MNESVIAVVGIILVCVCFVLLMMVLAKTTESSSPDSGSAPGSGPGSGSVPTAPATVRYMGARDFGSSLCRLPGTMNYTAYETHPETDMKKCRDKCTNESKCNAFESDGKDCWYYSGSETQQPGPPGQTNQCYVKVLPSEEGFVRASLRGTTLCRVPGNNEYTGYESQPETDIKKCRDKCVNESKCNAFETDGKFCWYYSGSERPEAGPSEQTNQCHYKVTKIAIQ